MRAIDCLWVHRIFPSARASLGERYISGARREEGSDALSHVRIEGRASDRYRIPALSNTVPQRKRAVEARSRGPVPLRGDLLNRPKSRKGSLYRDRTGYPSRCDGPGWTTLVASRTDRWSRSSFRVESRSGRFIGTSILRQIDCCRSSCRKRTFSRFNLANSRPPSLNGEKRRMASNGWKCRTVSSFVSHENAGYCYREVRVFCLKAFHVALRSVDVEKEKGRFWGKILVWGFSSCLFVTEK